MHLSLLNESGPQFDILEKGKINLTDDERERVMIAKAVWHFGSNGKPSPAIKKAIVRGKTYYYCNTHRCYQSAKTLDGAIKKFFDVVEPSS
jgi:hypothetical protein